MTSSPDAPRDVFILVTGSRADHRREGQEGGRGRKVFLTVRQPAQEKSSASTVAADAACVGRLAPPTA